MSYTPATEALRSPVSVVSMVSAENGHVVFVGDLAHDVTEGSLFDKFNESMHPLSAKVIIDPNTGRSKGFGFVQFGSPAERERAITEMNGVQLSSRVIRVSEATGSKFEKMRKKSSCSSSSTKSSSELSAPASNEPHPADFDPTNTTLFIGGLSSCVTETQLRDIFAKYGQIIYTKAPKGRGCGFVQFVDRWAAQIAFMEMDRVVIGNSALRISWGRSSSKLAAEVSAASHSNGSNSSCPAFQAQPQTQVPSRHLPVHVQQQSQAALPASWQYPTYMQGVSRMPWPYAMQASAAYDPSAYYPAYYMTVPASVPVPGGYSKAGSSVRYSLEQGYVNYTAGPGYTAGSGYTTGPRYNAGPGYNAGSGSGYVNYNAATPSHWRQPSTVLQTRG